MSDTFIKKFIVYIFIIIILLYHIMQIYTPETLNKNIGAIINLVEWIILVSFAIISFNIKFFHKLILGKSYKGGMYEGISYYLDENNIIDKKRSRKINFSIEHTLTKVKINGISKAINNNKNFDTVWKGYIYKFNNTEFYFALEVEYGTKEVGILKLVFNEILENENIGYYYSGDSQSKNQKIIFKRKNIE